MSIADIRQGLRAFLLADAGIAAAVGALRIYPAQLPQGMRQASIVYNQISDVGDHNMQGPSGVARPRFQIDAWAALPDEAAALALLIKNRLDGFSGVFTWGSNSPQDSITVQGVFFDNGREAYDVDANLYGKSQDFIIWFNER